MQPYYDSLIAKVIARGATRDEAIRRLKVALAELQVETISTNIPLHQALLCDPGFVDGGVDIHHLEHWLVKREQS
ncbi:acetyl-CoA carboxylase biotin carboxylase subunit [Acetobacter malorum]|uniref:biotin carboxylase n=1 Tax=Acetobacter malorum TaxID=178901 RepID=A0A177G289_9PROT|nr:acetyl-CoA carboxylase biotin carboxylase subunit [Acetobacter malorum]